MTVKIIVISEKLNPSIFKNSGGEVIERAINDPKNNKVNLFFKWAWQDSNLRPTDYESVALTN